MEKNKKKIIISKPRIIDSGDKSRELCLITIDDIKHDIFFDVPKKFGHYLINDRCDAYLIGLLHFALENNFDIQCNVPVTDELIYNINTMLLPSLSKYGCKVNNNQISIYCETIPAINKEKGFVGTGLSCGVDSFSAIKNHLRTGNSHFDLDYVVVNSVGSFNECYKTVGQNIVKEKVFERANLAADDMGIELIQTNSNFFEEIYQDHLLTNTFSSTFAIYMLQKLWRIYYLASSGIDYSLFSIKDYDSAHYDLLTLQAFSISNLRIYSEGGEKNRLEKTIDIADFEPAKKYLHVCVSNFDNCNVCSKCCRTLLSLYAIDKLDNFRECFDIEAFYKNKKWYFKWLCREHFQKVTMIEPIYAQLFKEKKEFKRFARLYKPLYKIKRILFLPVRLFKKLILL